MSWKTHEHSCTQSHLIVSQNQLKMSGMDESPDGKGQSCDCRANSFELVYILSHVYV